MPQWLNGIVDAPIGERRAAAAGDMKDLLDAMLSGVDKQTGAQPVDIDTRYQINP